ncbi:MAG: ATP-binding protein [Pseudonocardiaceae bacterium]
MGRELDVTVRRHGQVVMVHPRGLLTLDTATDLWRVLVKELHGHGRVVVDLDGFRLGSQASWVMIFPTVLAECGGWPAAKIALCRPDAEMTEALVTLGVPALVPVYHLQLEAKGAIDRRPDIVRMRTGLPGDVRAPARARRLIRDMCPLWQVDHDLQDTAQVVVNELVEVAIGPSGSAAELMLERGPRGLRLAVQDASPTAEPSRGTPTAEPSHGTPTEHSIETLPKGPELGLEMLGNLTTAWGVDVAPDGTTAWAVITD